MLVLALSAVLAAGPLEELKKRDFSILLKEPLGREMPSERCFFRKPVNQALSDVQQRLRLVGAGLRVLRCYEPGTPFATGTRVKVKLASSGQTTERALWSLMEAQGFQAINRDQGVFRYGKEKQPIESTPIRRLP